MNNNDFSVAVGRPTIKRQVESILDNAVSSGNTEANSLLLLGVDVCHLGMNLSRPLAAPSTTVSSFAMSLAAARHTVT